MSRTARRLGLAVAGVGFAAIAAFATAGPAAADNGPHISNLTSLAAADGCAQCHRMHTSPAEYDQFTFSMTVDQWCESCHSGTGAQTNVMDGVLSDGAGAQQGSTGLRAGGFTNAALNSTGATNVGSKRVGVLASPVATTSKHSLGADQTLWGSGKISGTSFTGSTVELECVSCHDPHGNGNFRSLRPIGMANDHSAVNQALNLTSTNIKIDMDTPIQVTQSIALLSAYNSRVGAITTGTSRVGGYPYYQDWTFKTLDSKALSSLTPGQILYFVDSVTATNVMLNQPDNGNFGSVVGTGVVIAVGTDTFTVTKQNSKYYASATNSPVFGDVPDLAALKAAGTQFVALPYLPSTVLRATVSADTLTVTYTTAQKHGMSSGQIVTVAGPSGFSISKAKILTAGTETFTVTSTAVLSNKKANAVAGPGAKLYISGIPDNPENLAGGADGTPVGTTGYKQVYTTANYWKADNHYANGSFNDTSTAATQFMSGIAQWCSSCHTRYYSYDSTGRYYSSGDSVFTYRHTSGMISGGDSSSSNRNCIQCHVAHGSNAAMDGTYSGQYKLPGGAAATEKSVLLRIDNRGTCVMCHGQATVKLAQ